MHAVVAGTGKPRDGKRKIAFGSLRHPARHFPRGLIADRAVCAQSLLADANEARFRFVIVGDAGAPQNLGRAGHGGKHRGDRSARAGLRRRKAQSARGKTLDQRVREIRVLRGVQIGAQMRRQKPDRVAYLLFCPRFFHAAGKPQLDLAVLDIIRDGDLPDPVPEDAQSLRQLRFADPVQAQRPRHDRHALITRAQTRHKIPIHHHAKLLGRSGKQNDRFVFPFDPKPRRGPAGVFEHDRPLRPARLTQIAGRHPAGAGREILPQARDQLRILPKRQSERFGDAFAAQIVLGRAEPADQDHQIRAGKRERERLPQAACVIAADLLSVHADPEFFEPSAKIGGIGIHHFPQKMLRSDADQLRDGCRRSIHFN